MFPHVVVALSTYNGGLHLVPLLESLLRQDYRNYQIVVRDDGSTDSTIKVINEYCCKYPERVILDRNITGNIGVTRSFLSLLSSIDDRSCLMFCDQDDVWFDRKISLFVDRLMEVEQQVEFDCPVLVFGDMVVTDVNLQKVADSFWQYQKIESGIAHDWRRVMMSNVVTGCSSILNPAAVKRLKNGPDLPILHDHLAAILVAKDGVLAELAEPTMFYRQHYANVEGAREFGIGYLVRRLGYFFRIIVPRYRKVCITFNVPLWLATYFKIESICTRLRRKI